MTHTRPHASLSLFLENHPLRNGRQPRTGSVLQGVQASADPGHVLRCIHHSAPRRVCRGAVYHAGHVQLDH